MARELTPWDWWRRPAERGEGEPFRSLHREIDRLFDEFTRSFPAPLWRGREGLLVPEVDIAETDTEVRVTAELPGVEDKDVDVTLANGVLTIKGEKKAEKEDKGKTFHRVERSYGALERSLTLPVDVDEDKVSATFKAGVLTVTAPKKPEAKTRGKKVAIETS